MIRIWLGDYGWLWDDYGWYHWDNDLPHLHLDRTNIVNTLRLCRSKVDLFCLSFHLQGQIPWRGKRHTKLESNTVGLGPLELSPTFSNYLELDLKWIELDLSGITVCAGTVQTWIVTFVFCHRKHPTSSTSTPRGLEPISQHPPHCRKPSHFTRKFLSRRSNFSFVPMWPTKKQLQYVAVAGSVIHDDQKWAAWISRNCHLSTNSHFTLWWKPSTWKELQCDRRRYSSSSRLRVSTKNGLQIGVGVSSV